MINFDVNFFFSKSLDFNNSKRFNENLKKTIKSGKKLFEKYKNNENQILFSFSGSYQEKIQNLKKKFDNLKKKKVIIGLGGSSSGAKAISGYIKDDIIYFDNLDLEYIYTFLKNKNLIDYEYYVISKSGETFETLAILNLLLQKAEEIGIKNINENIFIISDNQTSFLKKFSDSNKIKFIEHNPKIGGRYSVLSETGLFPFRDLNLNVEEASEKYLDLLINYDVDTSPVKNAAILLTCIDQLKTKIYFNLIYNYRLKHFSYWLHQLHAESIGKEGAGMTPCTSICPKDHHSMMQLFLDGPKDKFFNLFTPQDTIYFKKFNKIGFENIEKYSPKELLDKQFNSVVEVFREKKIPHRVIKITDHNNILNLFELFSYFILETIILGDCLGIDPYNQPAVQLIKEKI